SGGGFLQGYMRIFGQESMGRPDIELESEVNAVKKFFAKQFDESEIPEINAMMVFTSDDVEIDSGDAETPAMKLKQIKDFFRQKAKEKVLSAAEITAIKSRLPE
ncbi:MAG TPA: hypothetical protein DCX53_01830, partial [Anaerolineae bacterium]|nr:hypothetical protein [Anaerolineae bacterium]